MSILTYCDAGRINYTAMVAVFEDSLCPLGIKRCLLFFFFLVCGQAPKTGTARFSDCLILSTC